MFPMHCPTKSRAGGALFAGYLMSARALLHPDLYLIAAHIFLTFPFFICYTCRFVIATDPGHPLATIRRNQSQSIGVFAGYGAILFVLAVSLYHNFAGQLPPISLMLSVFFHSCLFLAYGLFLFLRRTISENILIRHTLIWPVVLSIATNLYLGLSWLALKSSFTPMILVLAILLYFVVSEIYGLSMKHFLWSSLEGVPDVVEGW